MKILKLNRRKNRIIRALREQLKDEREAHKGHLLKLHDEYAAERGHLEERIKAKESLLLKLDVKARTFKNAAMKLQGELDKKITEEILAVRLIKNLKSVLELHKEQIDHYVDDYDENDAMDMSEILSKLMK